MNLKSKTTLEPETRQEANPICDILASKKRRQLYLSPQDLEVIEQLIQNPPAPTSELMRAVREYKENKISNP